MDDSVPLASDVPSPAPRVDFTWTPAHPKVGELVEFQPHVQVVRGTKVIAWAWDLGDGRDHDGAAFRIRYPEAGTFLVTLAVTSDDGQHASASHEVTVLPM